MRTVLHSLAIALFCVAPLIAALGWWGLAVAIAVVWVAAWALVYRALTDPEFLETLMGEGP